ncbi:MAG: hypothetical protein DHS20C15_18760 [Planctomycetota bacterium]|nr:MAG: hypothetical protein DHS20C15_18760 [Planctomycetota bacterium]
MSAAAREVASGRAASSPADTQLVERALDGDQRAFTALYERFAPMVHAILLARAGPRDADDSMQDVFLAAWRGLHSLRTHEHVGAWLAAIARRQATRAGVCKAATTEALVEEPVARREDRTGLEILATLRQLPESYAETLSMRLVEGMTGPEIAAATGLTHGSVRVNLTRGMKLLKERLRREGWP